MQFKKIIFLSLFITSLHNTIVGMECFNCDVVETLSSEEEQIEKDTRYSTVPVRKRIKKKKPLDTSLFVATESIESQSEQEEERQAELIRQEIPEQVELICKIIRTANPRQQDILCLETWLNKHGKTTEMFVWKNAINELSKQVDNKYGRYYGPEKFRKDAANKVIKSFAYKLRPDKDCVQKSLSDQIKEEFKNIQYPKNY